MNPQFYDWYDIPKPNVICLEQKQQQNMSWTPMSSMNQTLPYKTVLKIFKANGKTKPQYWFLSLYWYYQRSNEPESSITQAENTILSRLNFNCEIFGFENKWYLNNKLSILSFILS